MKETCKKKKRVNWNKGLAKKLMDEAVKSERQSIRLKREYISRCVRCSEAAVNIELRRRMGWQEDGNKRRRKKVEWAEDWEFGV